MNPNRSSSSRWLWGLLAAVVAALIWWHATILLPFVISVILAYVLRPAVDALEKRRCPRALAAMACLLAVVLAGVVVFVLLVPIVSKLAPMLKAQLPDLVVGWWLQIAPPLAKLGLPVPVSMAEVKTELMDLLQNHGAEWGATLWQSLVIGGGNLASLVGLGLLIPMLAFYWLIDWDRMMPPLRELIPRRWRSGVNGFMEEADSLMGQYLRGQLWVMLILAGYYSLGLMLFGFELALPIGVFTGLAVCIPYLGFGLGMVLAMLAGVLQFTAAGEGLWQPLLGVAVVYGAGQVVESFYLTPRLVGERIGLHPLGVILALMLFGQWLGLLGLLIALPCAALATVLGRRLLQAYRNGAFFLTE